MSALKFTELQKHRLEQARRDMSEVLREIKQKPLKGKALFVMKDLEHAVSYLEVVTACIS